MDLKRVLAFLGEQGILSADEVGNPGEARAVLQGNDGWGVAERALGELGDEAVSLFIQWMGGSVADRPVERSHAAVLQAGSSSPTIVPSAGVGPSILEEVVPGAESNADGHRDDRSDRWPQLYSDFLEVFGVVRVAVSAGDIETLKPLRRASREGGVSLFSDEAMKASRLIREIEGRAPGAIPEYLLTGVMDALGEIFLPIDRSKATIVFIRYDGLFSGGEEAERFIEVIQNCPYVAGFYLENFPESILSGLGDRFPKFRAQEADRDKVNIVLLNGNAVGGKLDPWVVWKEVSNRLSDVYAPPPEGGLWSRYVIRSLGLDDLKPDGTLRDTRTGRRFAVGSYQGLNGPVVGMTRTMDALEPIEEGDFRRSILDHLPALPPGGIRLVHFVPGNSMQNSAIAKGGPDREIVVTIDNWGTARIEAFQTLRGIMVALGFDDSEAIVTAPVFFVGEGESAPVEPAQPALPAARYFHAFLGDGVLSLKPEQQEEVLTAQEVGAMIERAPSGVFSQHVREIRFGKEGEPDFFTLPVSGGGGGTPHPEEGTPDEPDPRNLAGPLSPESTRRMNELVDAMLENRGGQTGSVPAEGHRTPQDAPIERTGGHPDNLSALTPQELADRYGLAGPIDPEAMARVNELVDAALADQRPTGFTLIGGPRTTAGGGGGIGNEDAPGDEVWGDAERTSVEEMDPAETGSEAYSGPFPQAGGFASSAFGSSVFGVTQARAPTVLEFVAKK